MLRSKVYQFLRRSERFVQTDLVYLVKQGSWLFVNTVGVTLIGLVTSYLYANFLTKEQYGEYRYIFSIFTALNAFSLTGINVAVTQAVAKGKEGALLQSIPLQLKWNIFFCAAFIVTGLYYFWQGNTVFAISLLALSCLGPVANIANTYGAFLQGKKNFRAVSVIGLLTSFMVLLSVALVLFLRTNVVVLVIANIGTLALVQTAAFFWTLRKYKPNKVQDEGLRTFSKRISLLTAFSLIVSQIDNILVFNLLGAASVSILSFVTIIPDQLRGFVKIVGQLALPKFAVNETAESRQQAAKNSFKLAVAVLCVSIVYIVVAPWLFRLLFPAYQSWVGYTRLYALSMAFSVYQIPLSLLYAHRYEERITRVTLIITIGSLVISCITVPLFGLIGVVVGRMVAQAFNLAISSYYVWIKPPIPESLSKGQS